MGQSNGQLTARDVRTPARESIATLLAAAAIGTLQMGVAVSLAALIFTGPLAPGAGRASAAFILATSIALVIVGLRSQMTPVIAGVQDTAAIVAAAVAASIATEAAADARVPTVMVMLAIAAIMTGIAMWLIGRYGLGSIVRFLPYPVISGFVAGTGWLLFRGGIEVMVERPLRWSELGDLLAWSTSKFLVLGVVLGLFMVICVLFDVTSVAISSAILAAAIGFHIVGRSRSSIGELEADGWLIGPFPEGGGWKPIGPSDLSTADWGLLAAHSLSILAIVAVSIVGLMLNISGLEEVIDGEVNVDHEAQLSGISNVVIGVGGGLISYHLLGDTTLAEKLGVRSRVVPLLIAALAAGLFLFGYDAIALMPRGVAGGVLVGLGLTVLAQWARFSLPRMNRVDALVSALILAIIATVGILTGVGVGLLIATLFFVVRYSRIDPVRHRVDAAGRSNVERALPEKRALAAARGQIVALELQGFLFFGSITRLRKSLATFDDAALPRFVVFDFARVTGVDFTAASGLAAMAASLEARDITPVWSGMRADVRDEVLKGGVDLSAAHIDYDHAVAWAEEHVLFNLGEASDTAPFTALPSIFESLERRSLRAGEMLIDASVNDRDLYVVDSGRMSAWTVLEDGRRARLRQISTGAIIGEMAFCTGAPRTADVVADTEATVRVFPRGRFEELLASDPQSVIELQDFLLTRLADRLTSTSSLARDLMR